MDNFWPVDKLWIVKNLRSYPQVMHSGGKTTEEVIHRVIHIAECGRITTERKTRFSNGFLAGVPGLNSITRDLNPRRHPHSILDLSMALVYIQPPPLSH